MREDMDLISLRNALVQAAYAHEALLDHLLLRRIEPDLQSMWSENTINFRRGHQTAEAHAALHMAVCHAKGYGKPMALAKIDFKKAFDKCKLGQGLEAVL